LKIVSFYQKCYNLAVLKTKQYVTTTCQLHQPSAIRMYYDIIREMTQAQAFDEISHMFIDIEIFKKKYKGLIPPDMFDERTIRLEEILIKETERVMNIKRRPALMRKKR